MSKVIVIASGKGGTGKTFFAANMGAILAMQGKKTLLLDLDLGLRNLDLYLGVENKVVYNIMDVISGICGIKKALIRDKRFENLYLMPACPYKDERDITPLHMQVLINRLKKDFEYIIIDAPAGIGEGLELAIAAADSGVVVTEPELAAVRDADLICAEMEKSSLKEVSCVINKVRPELISLGLIPSIEAVVRGIRGKIIGFIQYDDNLLIATNSGVPIVLKPNTYIEKNLKNIVARITD